MSELSAVKISPEGIVKTSLSLNYTHETAMRAELNNILKKNTDPNPKRKGKRKKNREKVRKRGKTPGKREDETHQKR